MSKKKAPPESAIVTAILEDIARSGLDRDDMQLMGITPVPSTDSDYDGNAYRIPYFDLHGKPVKFCRYRFLDFTRDGQKYDQVKGSRPYLYLPPFTDWVKVLADPRNAVAVTEGEKKAAAMCKLGIPCIGLGGVWNWKLKGAGLLPEWAPFVKGSRKLTVVLDSDHDTNPGIQLARRRLLNALTLAGADAGYADIEQDGDKKLGVDDIIVDAGDGALAAITTLLAQRQSVQATLKVEKVTAAWLHTDLPPQEHALVALPMQEVSVLIAEGGAGKSSLALSMCHAIACGTSWAGCAVTPGAVLYVSAEDRAATLQRRLRWMRIARERRALARAGDDRAKRAEAQRILAKSDELILKHFHTACVNGRQLHVLTMQNGTVVQSPGLQVLINQALTVPALRLVILDPLARLHGCPENTNEVMTALANAADAVAQATGAAVLVLHHVCKSAARERELSAAAARGGSALADGCRSVLRLAPVDKQPKGLKLYTYNDQLQRTEVSDADYASERVLVLAHVKSNLSAKEPDMYVLRDAAGPSLHRLNFDATSDDGYAARLAKLREFAAKRSADFILNKEAMRTHCGDMDLTRKEAVTLLDDAFKAGDLIRDADYAAKNPRAKAYVFAPIPADPPDTRQHNGGYQDRTGEGGTAGIPADPPLPKAAGIFSAGIGNEGDSAPLNGYPPIPAKAPRRVHVLKPARKAPAT